MCTYNASVFLLFITLLMYYIVKCDYCDCNLYYRQCNDAGVFNTSQQPVSYALSVCDFNSHCEYNACVETSDLVTNSVASSVKQ